MQWLPAGKDIAAMGTETGITIARTCALAGTAVVAARISARDVLNPSLPIELFSIPVLTRSKTQEPAPFIAPSCDESFADPCHLPIEEYEELSGSQIQIIAS